MKMFEKNLVYIILCLLIISIVIIVFKKYKLQEKFYSLNKYLRDNCESIKPIHLNYLRNKIIAVDISIYMYKFLAENALLENMYLMISIFRKYNIKPIFIFDGKPPQQKNETLEERKTIRKEAFKEFKILKQSLKDVDEEFQQDIIDQMDTLKKKIYSRN